MKTLRFIYDFTIEVILPLTCGVIFGFALFAVVGGGVISDLEEKACKSGAAYWRTDDRGKSKLIWKHEEAAEVEKK